MRQARVPALRAGSDTRVNCEMAYLSQLVPGGLVACGARLETLAVRDMDERGVAAAGVLGLIAGRYRPPMD